MTDGRWTQAVRDQLALGALLAVGAEGSGAWLAESAAVSALRAGAARLPGIRLGRLSVAPTRTDDSGAAVRAAADPSGAGPPEPPTALARGPLLLTAAFAAATVRPLPETAAALRETLLTVAHQRLGLMVTEADLRVTALLDDQDPPRPEAAADPEAGAGAGTGVRDTPDGDADPDAADGLRGLEGVTLNAARAALAVPGVAALVGSFGGHGRAVRRDPADEEGGAAAVRVELAVTDSRPLPETVAAVRSAVAAAVEEGTAVTVLVTRWAPAGT